MNENRRDSKAIAWIMLVVMVLIGIVLLVTGVKAMIETKEKDKFYETTDGVVTEIEEIISPAPNDKESARSYRFFVEYEADGKKYTLEADADDGYKEEVGKKHVIRYNPSNPAEAHLGDGVADWAFRIFIGAFFIMIALVVGVDFKGKAMELMLLLLMTGVGMSMLYYSNMAAKTLNPFKSYICFLGYAFLGVGLLMLIGILSAKKQPEENGAQGRTRYRG